MLFQSNSFVALLVSYFLCHGAFASPTYSFRERDYKSSHVLTKDFLVLGGGASGTYAAVRLKDHGKSVALIERNDRLGGHTWSYIDPASGNTTETGVVIYQNLTTTVDFFNRFNIPFGRISFSPTEERYADFSTGEALPGYEIPNFIPAFRKWFASLDPYQYIEYGWNLTYPVPEDLLIPWGQYVKKNGLEDAALQAFEYSQSEGNILDQTTIYVAKYFGQTNDQAFVTGYLSTSKHNNSETYYRAGQYLGPEVFYQSRVLALKRTDTGVFAIISSPSGPKLIKAKKLVSSIPPKLNNLAGWDLTSNEKHLFGQFNNSAYWTALVTDTGLDNNISYTNIQPSSEYGIPRLPQSYGVSPTGTIKDVFHVYHGSPYEYSDDQVKARMIADVNLVQKLQGVPVKEPKFVLFDPHNPFMLAVTPDAIRNGFYKQLYALQGQKSTFWTGAAFHTHDSAMLWRFTESLLPTFLA